ncbi:MAG: DUF423 domain-containing protein, partial [Pedobacter sp.]|nr:DUF423 domain-containing protein [Pedobacter sp.]
STFARYKNKLINLAFIFFTLGIILFSGSLYAIIIGKIAEKQGLTTFLGPITPIGGLALILGWLCLFFAAIKDK